VYRNNHYTTAAGAELHVSKSNKAGQFGGGYESRAEIIHSNNLGEHERFYHSFYGEQRFDFSNSAVVVVGAMAQYSAAYGLNVYPGLEFSTPVFKQMRLFGNTGLGSRNPSYTDLYYSDRANLGNQHLKPEQAFNSELGLKWNDGMVQATSSAFLRRTSNFIDFTRATDQDKWMPDNFQLVTMLGVDTRVRVNFENKAKAGLEHISVSHTYLSGRLAEAPEFSKYALSNLRHQAVAQAQVRLLPALRVQLIARYLERFNAASYWVCDARLLSSVKAFDLAFDVTNLTNHTYFETGFVPLPGRMLRLSLTWKLAEKK
jgi:iron complex outermembrane receptor protein